VQAASTLFALAKFLTDFNQTYGNDMSVVPGNVLTVMGLSLGSSTSTRGMLFLEPALLPGGRLDAMWPAGTCQSLPLDTTVNVTLTQMLNATMKPALFKALNDRLQKIPSVGGWAGLGFMCMGVHHVMWHTHVHVHVDDAHSLTNPLPLKVRLLVQHTCIHI
jgi:hypothetical protein